MTTASTQRFVVIHKPTRNHAPIYYGPFVSERIADEFADNKLDSPTGHTIVRPLYGRQDIEH